MNPQDEALRRKELALADQVRRIFESDAWEMCYSHLMRRYTEQAMQPSTSDEDTLECKRKALVLHQLRKEFENIIASGRMAEWQIEADHERKRTRE